MTHLVKTDLDLFVFTFLYVTIKTQNTFMFIK